MDFPKLVCVLKNISEVSLNSVSEAKAVKRLLNHQIEDLQTWMDCTKPQSMGNAIGGGDSTTHQNRGKNAKNIGNGVGVA